MPFESEAADPEAQKSNSNELLLGESCSNISSMKPIEPISANKLQHPTIPRFPVSQPGPDGVFDLPQPKANPVTEVESAKFPELTYRANAVVVGETVETAGKLINRDA